MCTGRSKAENPQEIWDIGFEGMIGGNGCYVESDGEVVMHQLITADWVTTDVDDEGMLNAFSHLGLI